GMGGGAGQPNPTAASDRVFFICLGLLGGSYIVLIGAMLAADLFYTTPGHLLDSLKSEQIRYAIKLSLISCTITTVLSLWVAVPLGYLLSRTNFRGKTTVDTILDIPIVLPPLVIGLSLLILFQTAPGQAIERTTGEHFGEALTYAVLPALLFLVLLFALPLPAWRSRALAAL